MKSHSLGRKYSVHAFGWLLFAPYWYIISAILISLAIPNPFERSAIVPWLVALAVLIMAVLVIGQLRPRIYLYENGVRVLNKAHQSIWTWDELTHYEGERHNHGFSGIILWKTGANNFYAEHTLAFRVGAFTARADVLAHYIFSHMAEKHIPEYLATIRAGKEIEFSEGVTINAQSLNGYPWQQIKALRFDNDGALWGGYRVLADVEGRRFTQQLGIVFDVPAYILMGLVDALRGTHHLHTCQTEIPFWWRRWWRFTRTTGWKLALIFGAFLLAWYLLSLMVEPTQ